MWYLIGQSPNLETETVVSHIQHPCNGQGDGDICLPPAHVSSKIPNVVHFSVDAQNWKRY